MFKDRSILITGGTGSFGRQFVTTLLNKFDVGRIVVFSRDEQKHFRMQHDIPDTRLRFFIGDVRDFDRLSMAMRGIDLVIHAAAMKHVPLAEYNPTECIATNIRGAENVIRAAIQNDVSSVIALSTDKAANPINLYGATKLASDKLFVAANNITGSKNLKLSVVRYGNVCGSAGSVVPFFQKKIAEKSPYLPITDAEMTRFWITLQQGVDFVTSSFKRMQGGEIFVPKIPSVRIVDLAHAMSPDSEKRVVGIRPGEKLHEVMCPSDDFHRTIEFDDHFVIAPSIDFRGRTLDFSRNLVGEVGHPVPKFFEYNSCKNDVFLTYDEIVRYNHLATTDISFTLEGLRAGALDKEPARERA